MDFLEVLARCNEQEGNFAPLEEWVRALPPAELSTVRVTEGGHNPLEVAVVLCETWAVRLLCRAGCDPNTRCVGETASTPLHIAASSGENLTAAVLLEFGADQWARTQDGVTRLGQTVSVHSCGGGTPLILAAEAGFAGVCSTLLEACSTDQERRELLAIQDFNGNTAFDHVEARLALLTEKQETSPLARELKQIRHIFLSIEGLSENDRPIPSPAEALERKRKCDVGLRQRVAEKKAQCQLARRAAGLLAVERFYTPADPDLWQGSFDISCLSPALRAAVLARSSLGANQSLDTLGEGVLSLAVQDVVTDLHPGFGVFDLPMFSVSFAKRVGDMVDHYKAFAESFNDSSSSSELLPLYIRHDGNIGSLRECGFSKFLDSLLAQVLLPVQQALYPEDESGTIRIATEFVKKDFVEREENASFKVHRDKSDYTFNICLSRTDELEGSRVRFFSDSYDCTLDAQETGISRNDNDSAGRTELFVYQPRAGHCVVHTGRQWHQTVSISKGERSSMILWAERE